MLHIISGGQNKDLQPLIKASINKSISTKSYIDAKNDVSRILLFNEYDIWICIQCSKKKEEYAYIFLEDEITSVTENPDQRFV